MTIMTSISSPSSTDTSTKPIRAPKESLHNRVRFFIHLWGLKTLSIIGVGLLRFFQPLPRDQRPSLLKKYPVRPHLTNRVFVPRSHKPGEQLPLYLDIHGGGFALCDPSYDDEFCAHFCNKYDILVVALNYSKSPRVAFPVPTDDLEALVNAVLSDDSLSIDRTRVVIGGFSAGGNLALSAAQAPALRGKIHGAVLWYPVTEWVTTTPQKLNTRPFRNKQDVDLLESLGPAFNWGYVNPGEDLTNPRLSVSYADKKDLPEWIFTVAAEYDMLCNEAKEMMMNLAELKGTEREKGLYHFEKGTYRWRMARDVLHGYNQSLGHPGDDEERRLKRVDETYTEVGEWLFKGPFSK